MRFIAKVTLRFASRFSRDVAQEATVKSTTQVKGDEVKPVDFTGCCSRKRRAGASSSTKVVPVSQTTKTRPGHFR